MYKGYEINVNIKCFWDIHTCTGTSTTGVRAQTADVPPLYPTCLLMFSSKVLTGIFKMGPAPKAPITFIGLYFFIINTMSVGGPATKEP